MTAEAIIQIKAWGMMKGLPFPSIIFAQSPLNPWRLASMTGRKSRALQVPYIVPYNALGNFSKALYGTTGGTCSARFFRPVMSGIR